MKTLHFKKAKLLGFQIFAENHLGSWCGCKSDYRKADMGPKNKAIPNGADGKEDKLLQAVVIADSFDSSFAPLSHHVPRCLFPLANRPLIDYALTALSTSGAVSEIFVYCTSHAQMIKDHIARSWNRGPVSVSVVTNENCHSFGDAMRDLDAKGVLRYV